MLAPGNQNLNRRNRDLDDEIGYDLALEVEEGIRSGLSREQAEQSSRRDFGNVLAIKESIRETWSSAWIERLAQDLRFAARSMRGSPGFTFSAVFSLAAGIGTAIALFSVVSALPPAAPPSSPADPNARWRFEIRSAANPAEWAGLRASDYSEIAALPAFSDVVAVGIGNVLVTGGLPAESLRAAFVSPNALQFTGTAPMLGRGILESDSDSTGETAPAVVLGYQAWHRWFLSRANALGETLPVDGRPHHVVGVMPPGVSALGGDLWLPLSANRQGFVSISMRLRPGVSPTAAERQLRDLFSRIARRNPGRFPQAGWTARLRSDADFSVDGSLRYAFGWLAVVVGFLLTIACANVANLQLARLRVRSGEIAVRIALGAGRGRMLHQFLAESLFLTLAGGALGVLLSLALVRAIVALMPASGWLPRERIGLNGGVLLFAIALSLLTGILCGLAPALQCSRQRIAGLTSASGRGGVRSLFAAGEVALSVILLFGAIVTGRAFLTMQGSARGFEPVRVLAAELPFSTQRYPTYQSRLDFTQTVLERVRALPGVQSAAIANNGLFRFGSLQTHLSILKPPATQKPPISLALASTGYLHTLGIPLRAGRDFTTQEIAAAASVALINQEAGKLWPAGQNPIGSRVRLDLLAAAGNLFPASTGGGREVVIVGIFASTKSSEELGVTAAPLVLLPYSLLAPRSRRILVRTHGKPMPMWDAVRQQVQAIDPEQPIAQPLAVEDSLSLKTGNVRFYMILFGFVGALGLVLAAAGVYSVLSYAVTCRTHEIGIRIALGATPSSLLGMVLATGAKLLSTGVVIGLAGSFAVLSYVSVPGVPKTDPLAILAVLTLLIAAAVAACCRPAWRAARLDPMVALRHE